MSDRKKYTIFGTDGTIKDAFWADIMIQKDYGVLEFRDARVSHNVSYSETTRMYRIGEGEMLTVEGSK